MPGLGSFPINARGAGHRVLEGPVHFVRRGFRRYDWRGAPPMRVEPFGEIYAQGDCKGAIHRGLGMRVAAAAISLGWMPRSARPLLGVQIVTNEFLRAFLLKPIVCVRFRRFQNVGAVKSVIALRMLRGFESRVSITDGSGSDWRSKLAFDLTREFDQTTRKPGAELSDQDFCTDDVSEPARFYSILSSRLRMRRGAPLIEEKKI